MSADLPPTLALLPFYVSGRFPKPDLLGRCRAGGVDHFGGRELVERVRDVGLGLGSIGLNVLKRGERVAVLAESRPEWLIADLAILATGAVTIPVYPSLPADQVEFLLRDSGTAIAIVSTTLQFAKIQSCAPRLPALRAVVTMEEIPDADATVPVFSLRDISARGHQRILDTWGQAKAFHDEAKRVQPDDVASIIYTSGTTGEPKGVVLTHANLVANIMGVKEVVQVDDEDHALSFLPLSHAFERLVAYFYLASGCTIAFAESFDTVGRDLGVVRPTILTGVPRLFEKIRAQVLEAGSKAPGIERLVFRWAARAAERYGAAKENGGRLTAAQRLGFRLADALVFRKVRDRVGGRLRFGVSGSAPLPADVGRFFYGMGVPILEGYGLTECAPVVSVMPLDRIRFGTVGRPLPNVEVRVDDDGEILVRGPNVMAEYWNRPTETSAAFVDGWLRTGDVGAIDTDGFLRLTDRKKELIVTSGGKKVAPQPIEAALKGDSLIADAALVGDGRKFIAALLAPNMQTLAGPPDPRVYDAIVDRVNARLAPFERIRRFAVVPRAFSVESGELTPTLKLKRRVIEKNYKEMIDEMYRA